MINTMDTNDGKYMMIAAMINIILLHTKNNNMVRRLVA